MEDPEKGDEEAGAVDEYMHVILNQFFTFIFDRIFPVIKGTIMPETFAFSDIIMVRVMTEIKSKINKF